MRTDAQQTSLTEKWGDKMNSDVISDVNEVVQIVASNRLVKLQSVFNLRHKVALIDILLYLYREI